MTWDDARSYCQQNGADLARTPTRRNISEVNRLISGEDTEFWIGLQDEFDDGRFTWIDGTDQGVDNWATGEPDCDSSMSSGAVSKMTKSRKWIEEARNETRAFICEKRDKSM